MLLRYQYDAQKSYSFHPNVILQSGAEYLIRVTFGTALIASIVIVYTTIIAILSSSR